MITRTLCDVDACGLMEGQIKEILIKAPGGRYNYRKGVLKFRNFERARVAREMRSEFIRANIREEIEFA